MTIEPKTCKPAAWQRRIRLAAVLTCLVGAVYVTTVPLGNAQADSGVNAATQAAAAIKPYARGQVAAFVAAEAPKPVADIVFVTRDGMEKKLADYKGKVILVNLWATWCAPCKHEMPALNALQKDLGGDRFEVIAINIDRGGPAKGEKFYAEANLDALGFFHDVSARIFRQVRAFGMPTSFLVDTNGYEIGRLAGPAEWHSQDAIALIKAALGAKGAS